MYSHTPSETILKDTSPKITVKTCKNSQNILETSNLGERSFIAKILADLIAKEDAFGFWSEDSSAAAIHLLALFHFAHRICHASYFGHCQPFIFIELPWEIILAAAVDSAMSFAIGFRESSLLLPRIITQTLPLMAVETSIVATACWCCVYNARGKCLVDMLRHCNCNSTWHGDRCHPIDVCCCDCNSFKRRRGCQYCR